MRKKNSITIAEIAKKAGVSRTTVSFYLNEKFEKMSGKTRERIKEVIEETDFVPNALARSLNNKQSHLIGLMVQGQNGEHKENTLFVQGVQDVLQSLGYQVLISTANADLEEERKTVERMLALNVDGVIVNPSDSFDLLWKSMKTKIPLVAYNPAHTSRYPVWIRSNDYEAAYLALETAAKSGYRRFILVTEEKNRHSAIAQRMLAFDHLTEYRHLRQEIIYVSEPEQSPDLEFELISQIQIDTPTCFFVTTPELLSSVYLILRRYQELMPAQLGLIGFDSQEWSRMVSPSVTTIVQPAYEEGAAAARLIIDRLLEKNEELPNQIFECELIQGETTIPSRITPQSNPETEKKGTETAVSEDRGAQEDDPDSAGSRLGEPELI